MNHVSYSEINENERNLILEWSKKYISQSVNLNCLNDFRHNIKECSCVHYSISNMEQILSAYIGKLNEFIQFIRKEWNWIITYDENEGIIIADENKNYCVCPLAKYGIFDSTELCNCSEGFAEKMFSEIIGKPVKATVERSFLRNNESCIYRITIK
jgi:hypothetical protein